MGCERRGREMNESVRRRSNGARGEASNCEQVPLFFMLVDDVRRTNSSRKRWKDAGCGCGLLNDVALHYNNRSNDSEDEGTELHYVLWRSVAEL